MSISVEPGFMIQERHAQMSARIGLLFVDGRRFMRDCLARWLAGEMPDLDVSVLSDAAQLPAEPADAAPAVALLFLAGGGAEPESWLREQVDILRARDEGMPIVVLVDPENADRAEAMAEALLLQGYIPTSSSASVVGAALRLVLAGGVYLPRAARRPARHLEAAIHADRAEASAGEPRLTPREDRVLDLVAKGLPNKIIAYRLGMSVSTVKVHVHHLIQKLRAQNRTELAILAPSFRASRAPASGSF